MKHKNAVHMNILGPILQEEIIMLIKTTKKEEKPGLIAKNTPTLHFVCDNDAGL